MNVAALIVGIDNWERYTRPLVDSIRQHEPDDRITVTYTRDGTSAEAEVTLSERPASQSES